MAGDIGSVSEVKIKAKGDRSYLIDKARVTMDLSAPLLPRSIFSKKGENIWLELRHERLLHYYSCGKLGHYA